jgi:epsin
VVHGSWNAHHFAHHSCAYLVRVSAKELTTLILDEERLRAERQDRKSWKSRVTGIEEFGPQHGSSSDATRPRREHRNRRQEEEDLEYRLAIEASKNEAEEDAKRRARLEGREDDDDDLAKAIKLSKEEEELRRRELEESNASSLFDDTPAQPAASQPTGWNQGYQQQGAVDWYGNLVDQQQPQNTGFLNNAYSQQQPQQTANGFGFQQQQQQQQQQQPQQTGFDQFGQQPFMQPQQTSFNANNPYNQTQNGFGGFGQQPQQTQQQTPSFLEQQNTLQPGNNNPWAASQNPNVNSVKPQPTGSNNPFASNFNRPQPQNIQSAPTLAVIQEQKTQSQFNNQNFNPPVSFSAQQPTPNKPVDPHHARLNQLLASGEGQDTFGNIGDLRIPAQHTAPGTFVNSAGAGVNRLTNNATGTNPFLHSQYTGMPPTNRLQPAQTGPASAFGTNPFGRSQPGAQQTQTGSLIDL